MNTLVEGPLNALKAFIKELATVTYSQENKGLLLSRVGELIAKQHPELRKVLEGRKLVEFIEKELADSVNILTSAENNIVKVILPTSVNIRGDVSQFFPKRNATGISGNKLRYNRAFWAAFSHPIANDSTRLLGFDPQVHFEDIEGDVPPTTHKKVITQDLVIDETKEPDPVKRVQRINEIISNWLQTNAVNVGLVEAKTEKCLTSTSVIGPHKGSLLEVLLGALGDDDLKRIQMPLDVVAKLHRLP